MERDLNFTVTDGRRDDSVRVNGGISEYAEVRSRTAELFRRPGIRVTAALLCCLLWGSAFPCVKMGYEMLNITDTGSQILFAGYRFVLAGIFTFLAGCLIEKRALLPRKTALPAVAGQAMLQTALQYVFFYVGMAHTTGIKGSVINSSDVFFAMFAAHFLIRGERVTWRKMIGCIIGFAGVFSVNLQPGAWDSGRQVLGGNTHLIFLPGGKNFRQESHVRLLQNRRKLGKQRLGAGIGMGLEGTDHPLIAQAGRRLQQSLKLSWMLGIVVIDRSTLDHSLILKPAAGPPEIPEPLGNGLAGHP